MVEKPRVRFRHHRGRLPKIVTRGRASAPLDDLYHFVLTRSWPQFFGLIILTFVGLNAFFALLYLAVPGSVQNARQGSLEDVFFFSVHTLGTIGYGSMAPAGLYGNVIVAIEALVGMISVALMTGITFARVARPSAKILFSQNMLIQPRNGVPHLVFRLSNWRHNQVVEAQLRVILLVTEKTTEGDSLRRPIELPLVRDRNAMFGLTWAVMHRIDEASPFYGPDALAALRAKQGELFLSMTGYDETIMQSIHARYAYALDDIIVNARFADILTVLPDGTRVIDYAHFDEVLPLDPVDDAK